MYQFEKNHFNRFICIIISSTAKSQSNERLVTIDTRTSTASSTDIVNSSMVTNSQASVVTKDAFKLEKVTPSSNDEEDSFDSMHLMLEEHLRPVPPKPNNRLSKEIFEEHKHLAKEYLKVTPEKKN